MCQTISFVYMKVMKFHDQQFSISNIVTKNQVINLLFGKTHLHHSHVSSQIIGYSHSFYNQKVRENKNFFQHSHTIFSA